MKKFWKNANFRLKIGIIVTAIFLILGFVIYYIPHEDPALYNSFPNKLRPSLEHLLGTTSLGQDIFWMLIESIHNSLMIGFIVATIGTVVGVMVGLIAGFSGGFVDKILMLITDTFVVVPSLPILILMAALMRGSSTAIFLALIIAMFAWAWPSRQIRSMALSIKERDFIKTAWFSGEGTFQVVFTEILPYALTWSLSNFMNATLSAIASESGLAVLGLAPADLVSLGHMLQWARERNAILAKQWYWIGSPLVAMILLFIGLFLLITGYNDYISLKRGRS